MGIPHVPGNTLHRRVAVLGDVCDHGAVIITSCRRTLVDGIPVARYGDLVACPLPNHGVNPIVKASGTVWVEGQRVARVGDTTACGATIITGSGEMEVGDYGR